MKNKNFEDVWQKTRDFEDLKNLGINKFMGLEIWKDFVLYLPLWPPKAVATAVDIILRPFLILARQQWLKMFSFRGKHDEILEGQIRFFLLLCQRLKDEYEKFEKETKLNA